MINSVYTRTLGRNPQTISELIDSLDGRQPMSTSHSKKCNKCGFVGHLDYFITGKRYKDGHRPLCKMCHFKLQRKKRGMPEAEWQPIWRNTLSLKAIELLIKNGYARNEEEARKYAKW